MKLTRALGTLLLLCGVAATPSTASAGAILNPGAVAQVSIGEFGPDYAVSNLLNQSGLSAAYVSGVTDFSSFVASTTHTADDTQGWLSAGPTVPATIDFDLGAEYLLNRLAWWNHAVGSTANVESFRLFAMTDATFTTGSQVGGTFTNPQGDSSLPYPATVFDIPDVTTRYLRLRIDGYYGNDCCVAIGELAFETPAAVVVDPATVPEPSSLILFGSGILAAGIVRRRRRR